MTNQQLIDKIADLEKDNLHLDKKVKAIQSGGIQLISEEQLAATRIEHEYYVKNWIKHRRGCMDIVDIFSDFMDQKPKVFMKNLELDQDEDFGVSLKDMR